MNALNNLQAAVELLNKDAQIAKNDNVVGAIDLIFNFVVANTTPAKCGKFSIWEYTGNDDLDIRQNGVFYDTEDQVAVATDKTKLVAVKGLYREWPEEMKNSQGQFIIAKDGSTIDARFFDWKRIIKCARGGAKLECISQAQAMAALSEIAAYKKLEKGHTYGVKLADGLWVAESTLCLMTKLAEWEFDHKGEGKPIHYDCYGVEAAFMPIKEPTENVLKNDHICVMS